MKTHKLKKFFSYFFSLFFVLTSVYLPLRTVDAAGVAPGIATVTAEFDNPIIINNEFYLTFNVTFQGQDNTKDYYLKNAEIKQNIPTQFSIGSMTATQNGTAISLNPASSTSSNCIDIKFNDIKFVKNNTADPIEVKVKLIGSEIGKYNINHGDYTYTNNVGDTIANTFESEVKGLPAVIGKINVYPKLKVLYVHGMNEFSEFADGSMTIHFKKPPTWSSSTPKIHYYGNGLTGTTWLNLPYMIDEGGGWYYYKLPAAWRSANAQVVFKDGSNSKQLPAPGAGGIAVSKDTKVYADGSTADEPCKQADPRLDIDSMSIESFVSHTLMEINGKYDIVYFGKGVYIGKDDDRNTGKAVANFDENAFRFLEGLKAGVIAPNYTLSNQTISSWDITEKMKDKVIDYIGTGQPVVFNNDVFKPGLNGATTNFSKYFGTYTSQATGTNIETGYLSGSPNVWKVDGIDDDTIVRMFGVIGTHKPYMNVLASPQSNICYSYEDVSKRVINYKVKCVNFNNTNPIRVILCLDKNGNGVYDYNPNIAGANGEAVKVVSANSGDEQSLLFPMPSEYMGGQYWKIIAWDGTTQKSEASNYFIYKGDTKNNTYQININVLQIMPKGTGSSLENLFNQTDTEERIDHTVPSGGSNGTIGYWPGVFKITVKAVTAQDFQNNVGNCRSDLDSGNKYGMLIFGFGDSYTKGMEFNSTSLASIKKFIDSGKGVMFVHDTMSGIDGNRELKDAFLNKVGQIFQPTIYAGNYPAKVTDGRDTASTYISNLIERINTCGGWSCSNTDLMSKMRKKNSGFDTGDSNGVVTQKVSNINAGVITTFPYQLDTLHPTDKAFNGASTLNISKTHIQYYRLNLEEADPWYNMCYNSCATDPHGTLDIDDSANTYYTYSIGNITFSGTGHNEAGYTSAKDELKLFVNTVLKTYVGGNKAPGIIVEAPNDDEKVPKAKNTVDFTFDVSDYDKDDLWVKIYIARCPGSSDSDINRTASSLLDSDFAQVPIGNDDIVIDRDGDGKADSKPDAIRTNLDGSTSIKVQDGDRIIKKGIEKNLDVIPDGKLSRNFFLKAEVTDDDKTTNKIVPLINYDGPMIDIVPTDSVITTIDAETKVPVSVNATGENRIPMSPIDKIDNINAKAKIVKDDGTLDGTPVTSDDVEIITDKVTGVGSADCLLHPYDSFTILHPVIYHPINESTGDIDDTLLSSKKAKVAVGVDKELWEYKLKFKKDGTYKVTYSADYDVTGNHIVDQKYSKTTIITVYSKPSLPYVKLMNRSLTYQNISDAVGASATYPDDADSPAVKMKIKFKLKSPTASVKDCKVVLAQGEEKVVDGKINNDFSITKATLTKTGGTAVNEIVSGKTINLGELTTTTDAQYYELTVEVKGIRLFDQNFCGARIVFSKFQYQKLGDTSTESISLEASTPDTAYLPTMFSPGVDNSMDFTVYKVLNDQ